MIRPGYVPKGNGELEVSVEPAKAPLKAFEKTQRGEIRRIQGISLASHLAKHSVARRMAERSRELLAQKGYNPEIDIVEDTSAVQSGAALLLWAESTKAAACLDSTGRESAAAVRSQSRRVQWKAF